LALHAEFRRKPAEAERRHIIAAKAPAQNFRGAGIG
jgi:hypothetical protein